MNRSSGTQAIHESDGQDNFPPPPEPAAEGSESEKRTKRENLVLIGRQQRIEPEQIPAVGLEGPVPYPLADSNVTEHVHGHGHLENHRRRFVPNRLGIERVFRHLRDRPCGKINRETCHLLSRPGADDDWLSSEGSPDRPGNGPMETREEPLHLLQPHRDPFFRSVGRSQLANKSERQNAD